MRVSWTARRSNQSIVEEISPEYSLEGADAEAQAPIFWPPDAKKQLIGKDPDAQKIEGGSRGHQRMRWLHGISDAMGMNLSRLCDLVNGREDSRAAVYLVAKIWTN